MRSLIQPNMEFHLESPDALARVIPTKPGVWQRSIGSAGQWTDAHIPRTSSPVRFDYLRVSAWCAPRHRFQSVTYFN